MVLVGTMFITFALNMMTTYGNLLPYVASYFQAHRHSMAFYVSELWPSTAYNICFPVAMVFASPLERRYGILTCITAGLALTSLSTILGFFTVNEPLMLTLVFGALQGMSVGVSYSLTWKILLASVSGKGGLASGIMSIGPAVGSVVSIGLAYAVVNPYNAKPDLRVEKTLYFSDPGILGRVPYYFLTYGLFITVVTSIGMILTYIGNGNSAETCKNDKAFLGFMKSFFTARKREHDHLLRRDVEVSYHSQNPSPMDTDSNCDDDRTVDVEVNGTSQLKTETDSADGDDGLFGSEDDEEATSAFGSGCELTPWETLQTGRFWCVWFSYLALGHTFYVQSNLYKQYGQLIISSDIVLVVVGLLSTVFMVVARLLAGVVSDRFGVQGSLIGMCFTSSVSMTLMVVGVHLSAGLHIFASVVEFAAVSTMQMVYNLFVAFLFGKSHFASNTGLVYSAMVVNVIVEPFVVSGIIRAYGWDWVFISGAVSAAIAMILSMSLKSGSKSSRNSYATK